MAPAGCLAAATFENVSDCELIPITERTEPLPQEFQRTARSSRAYEDYDADIDCIGHYEALAEDLAEFLLPSDVREWATDPYALWYAEMQKGKSAPRKRGENNTQSRKKAIELNQLQEARQRLKGEEKAKKDEKKRQKEEEKRRVQKARKDARKPKGVGKTVLKTKKTAEPSPHLVSGLEKWLERNTAEEKRIDALFEDDEVDEPESFANVRKWLSGITPGVF